MPNGGYPMHLLTPIQGSDLALHAQGSEVHLLERQEQRPRITTKVAPRGTTGER